MRKKIFFLISCEIISTLLFHGKVFCALSAAAQEIQSQAQGKNLKITGKDKDIAAFYEAVANLLVTTRQERELALRDLTAARAATGDVDALRAENVRLQGELEGLQRLLEAIPPVGAATMRLEELLTNGPKLFSYSFAIIPPTFLGKQLHVLNKMRSKYF